jgi:phosphatidylserine/phosphatidylglycerophosphate/cardiolipin synthase-like enzyme
MNKLKFSVLIGTFCLFITSNAQVISISAARSAAPGTQVTVRGLVTNGAELGVIRYFQDATAGLAAYSPSMANVKAGDSIEVTGISKNYMNLLELDPVSSFTVISSGNKIPDPITLSSVAAFAEAYEGMLVKVKQVVITGSGLFSGGTSGMNYRLDNNVATQIRILPTTDIPGMPIPVLPCNITGVMSQFNTSYQLLPRFYDDLDPDIGPKIISSLMQKNIMTDRFDVSFNTKYAGNTVLRYGLTPALELGSVSSAAITMNHLVTLPGLQNTTFYYVKAVSFNSTGDSSVLGPVLMSTASLSSGTIKAYFTRSVRNALATFSNASYANQSIDDTVIAYIGRAKYSIDIAIYNWNNSSLSDITDAVNQAYNRGVKLRIVYDGSTSNLALANLNPAIGKIASPQGANYTIMHNKFMVIDANSADPMDPVVLSGSTNWTAGQINSDANNALFIQDQSLAKAYTLEFEEMYGSSTLTPNPGNARFGQFKLNNTPHYFNIGGKQVEQFFSPSDGTSQQILNAIKTANTDLYFQVLTFTRRDIAKEIAARASAGVFTAGAIDDTSSGSLGFNDMKAVMGNYLVKYSGSGLLHHKMAIIDANNYYSDPTVVTGSHNWSNSADQKNDENTLIIHDADLANQYFQEFANQSKIYGVPWGWGFANFKADSLVIRQYHAVNFKNLSVFNDAIPNATTLSWNFGDGVTSTQPDPSHVFTQPGQYTITLIADNGNITDTIVQNQLITVVPNTGFKEKNAMMQSKVLPNPTVSGAKIYMAGDQMHFLRVYDIMGRMLLQTDFTSGETIDMTSFSAGIYLFCIDGIETHRVVKE